MIQLILPEVLRMRSEGEARAGFPRECCGLIAGRWDGPVARALILHAAPNIAAAPDRFEIEPQIHFAALKSAPAAGQELIGCYHSHPAGLAEPSSHDLAGAEEDGFLWLVAALAGPQAPVRLQAFRFEAHQPGEFHPIGLVTGADLVTSSP